MNILITGANGFVGSALCQQLVSASQPQPLDKIYAVSRLPLPLLTSSSRPPIVESVTISSLAKLASSEELLSQVDCVIHLAARVHQMEDRTSNPLSMFRSVNTEATYNLAKASAQCGVRRFIYLSSIKVNGEGHSDRRPYTEADVAQPVDPYGQSKQEAEVLLQQLSKETSLETVILRPPLVYGPQVKANFLQLIELVQKGLPLPFRLVDNARSLVFVGNLVDAIITCMTHPDAVNQTFLLSDGQDLSTPNLIRHLANALHRPCRLLPLPPNLLYLLGHLTGKTATINRLLSSLVVDSTKIQTLLHWHPPFTATEGLQATANWYLQSKSTP